MVLSELVKALNNVCAAGTNIADNNTIIWLAPFSGRSYTYVICKLVKC